ncbi:MAG: MFS transporter [Candidatus Marinimicrobia bacterium]|jgi:nucleoside transporter|nr:MFS transporter [Candidatus Neomarinimicrobiota bacterium]MBT3840147.1 MFS transporter [Candidatus Neomarinimicrobiota bacterium]MBT3999141.1 MFS transporter [Candidatus Neomarinimicrobiota bacterium]MBT4282577.1 MFS transporter [Candidatus Neomarinimicrobiota bacterium]MBT4579673.1 MFS transporter [Candidatus Neomarinimicrobiota bacterium]
MNKSTRLSGMMFLQYALWGAWLPLTARYLSASVTEGGLGFTGTQIGMILGLAGSLGAAFAPFIAGQLADRYFSTEKFLAVLMLVGGVLKWYTSMQTTYSAWLILSIAYSIVYMPTIALTNSLTFFHIDDPDNEFPKIRVWGTIGWIVASWAFPMIWLQSNLSFQWMPPFFVGVEVSDVTARLADALKFSGIISIFYAGYCFLLPHTPPKADAVEKLAFKKAFLLFKKPSFKTLVIASLAISIVHQIYFIQAGPFLSHIGLKDSQIGPAMTIGQFAEIITMIFLGYFLKNLGFRKVITIGTVAYFARYAVFGTESLPVWLIVVSQALHGICFAFFFAAAFMYVDRITDKDIRHSAQTVFGIIILGGGPVIGGWLSGFLQEYYTVNGVFNFSNFWYTIAGLSILTTVFFFTSFREELDIKTSN